MPSDKPLSLDRRAFLAATAAVAGTLAHGAEPEPKGPPADGRPPVRDPRGTSGDLRHEPAWAERLTLTVGNDKGDLCGKDEKVIQAAVDSVARLGGGTVKLLP